MKIVQMLTKQNNFSSSDIAISNYILKNPDQFILLNIKELAKETFTSPASIVRFCKKMGFSGFNSFKNSYLKEQISIVSNTPNVNSNIPFTEDDSFEEISNNLSHLMKDSIDSTLNLIDFSNLKQIIEVLANKSNIFLFGVSVNHVLAQDFQHKMLRLDKHIILCSNNGDERHLAITLKEDDVAILISYSGETSLVISIAKILKKKGTKIISITGKQSNTLSKLADYKIQCSTNQQSVFNISNFSYEVSIIYIFNIIYSCLFSKDFESNYIRKISNDQLIRSREFNMHPHEDIKNKYY